MQWERLANLPINSYLDVGTNAAQFFQEFWKMYRGIRVEFIEANPWCCSKLAKRFKKIPLHNVAVGKTNCTMQMHIFKGKRHSKAASLYKLPGSDTNIEQFEVEVKTFDSIFNNRYFDFIKFDIQGAELDAMQGSPDFIKQAKFLLIEVTPNAENYPGSLEVVNYCRELGFWPIDVVDEYRGQFDILFSNQLDYKEKDVSFAC